MLQANDARTALEPQQPAPLQAATKSPADHSVLLHPDQLQTLVVTEGHVTSTDPAGNRLVIEDLTGHLVPLQTTANTRILDPQNNPFTLADLKPKDHVRFYYDRKSALFSKLTACLPWAKSSPANNVLNRKA